MAGIFLYRIMDCPAGGGKAFAGSLIDICAYHFFTVHYFHVALLIPLACAPIPIDQLLRIFQRPMENRSTRNKILVSGDVLALRVSIEPR